MDALGTVKDERGAERVAPWDKTPRIPALCPLELQQALEQEDYKGWCPPKQGLSETFTIASKEDADGVYHPHHYARWAMEPIEFIAINNLPWWLHNVIKYTMRFDAKDGLKDLYKAKAYLEMKIRELEKYPRFWDKPVTDERAANARWI